MNVGVPAERPPMSWIYLRGGPADGRTMQGLAWGPVVYVHPDPPDTEPLRYVKSLPAVGFLVLREAVSYPAGTLTALVALPHDVATVYDYAT